MYVSWTSSSQQTNNTLFIYIRANLKCNAPPEVIKTTSGGRFYYFILTALILYQSNPYLLKDTFYSPRQHASVIVENKDVLSLRMFLGCPCQLSPSSMALFRIGAVCLLPERFGIDGHDAVLQVQFGHLLLFCLHAERHLGRRVYAYLHRGEPSAYETQFPGSRT